MLTINIIPYIGREERLKLTKELRGRIIIEADYIVQIEDKGGKQ